MDDHRKRQAFIVKASLSKQYPIQNEMKQDLKPEMTLISNDYNVSNDYA